MIGGFIDGRFSHDLSGYSQKDALSNCVEYYAKEKAQGGTQPFYGWEGPSDIFGLNSFGGSDTFGSAKTFQVS